MYYPFAIVRLVDPQCKSAFFVGGLSTNDWLWSRIQLYFKERKINISRPDNHMCVGCVACSRSLIKHFFISHKAVAYGAVLSHVDRDNHLVSARVTRTTFGVVCTVPVNEKDGEHIRRKNTWEIDPAGGHYVPGYFESKIRKVTSSL